MSGKPVINYFNICGRGELARLVCAAGELEFDDRTWSPAFEDGGWRQGYQAIGTKHNFPGTMPVLEHGDLALFQSQAIESYLASIAPKFKDLTPAQRAKDLMFALCKADINVPTESLLFKKITPEELTPIMDKWLNYVEGMLPESGFVNGLAFPTMADLSVLVIAKGCMPFQAASTMANCSILQRKGQYPKIERIMNDCLAYPAVANFLKNSEHKTLTADPFGIMPAEYKA